LQWQNNKAPQSKEAVGPDVWVGINLLVQYFRERFYSNAVVMPNKFSRLVLKKSEAEIHAAAAPQQGEASNVVTDDVFQYLDAIDEEDRKEALEAAGSVEIEEDEEYRVRSAAVTSIACVRAKDGFTPALAIQVLEAVLKSEDAEMVGNPAYADEDIFIEEIFRKTKSRIEGALQDDEERKINQTEKLPSAMTYVSSMLVADALLALCHVNSMPAVITDPATGKPVQASGVHPLNGLKKLARSWLDWELYRENIRLADEEQTFSGISGNCNDCIVCSAIVALSNLAIQIQSTTDAADVALDEPSTEQDDRTHSVAPDNASSAQFYIDIFDSMPHRNDLTRAACAQALSCICCAADRFEKENVQPVGLLTSLEFLLDRIIGMFSSLIYVCTR
jgi:hypothetical protein